MDPIKDQTKDQTKDPNPINFTLCGVKVAYNPNPSIKRAVVCVKEDAEVYTVNLRDTSKFMQQPSLFMLNFRSKSYRIKWSKDGHYLFIAGESFVFILNAQGQVLFEDHGISVLLSVEFNGNTVEADGFDLLCKCTYGCERYGGLHKPPQFCLMNDQTLEESNKRFALKRDSQLFPDLREKFEEKLPTEVVDIIMNQVREEDLSFIMPAKGFKNTILNGKSCSRFYQLCDHMWGVKNTNVYCDECRIGCQ